jgi:hypothetical protein
VTNNLDHISESLETIFRVKILKFFDSDPGSGMEKFRILDPGFATLFILAGYSAAAEPVPAAGGRGLRRLVHGPAPPPTPLPRPSPSQQVR